LIAFQKRYFWQLRNRKVIACLKLRAYLTLMDLNETIVRAALAGLNDLSGTSLLKSELLSGIDIRNGQITVVLSADKTRLDEFKPLQKEIERCLQKISGVSRVLITFTAERTPALPQKILPQIKRVIAIASGKGGVGKSTTAANLALALSAHGNKVGLLDADIYGPSMPHLFGLSHALEQSDDGRIEPAQAHGIKLMSIGLMVEHDMPLVWRGPMIDKALTQFLNDVNWGELDYLVIDMPPGTGDAQITLTRKASIDGAIIVSTPQDLSLIDARKGIALFRQAGVPVLGIIENMSEFICPQCGMPHDIFSAGGAKREASRQGIAYLGEVPLHMSIRETSDSGMPLVAAFPDCPEAQAYFKIADKISMQSVSAPAHAVVNKT
jgi:ATP-binding protein involved in chromosome partitioning